MKKANDFEVRTLGTRACQDLEAVFSKFEPSQLEILSQELLWPQLFGHVSSIKDLSGLANHHLCHTEKLRQLFENDIGGAQEICIF
jgi:hypothetical protein